MLGRRPALLILTVCVALVACSCQSDHSPEQIKSDLIGRDLILEGIHAWSFDALSEFEQFDIRAKQRQGNVIEYDVSMRLRDLAGGKGYLADVLIVYRHSDGRWALTSVVTKLFEWVD